MVLWYNGKMLATPNNLYRMSTATSIANSGLGNNALTKPAGTEVASIQPGVRYANYTPSAATFTTDFNADSGNYTIWFYAKPNEGNVLSVAGNVLTYANNTFMMVNAIGESLSIPFDSHRAHLIVFTYSDMEAGVRIDGEGGVIPAATTDATGPLDITLLEAGGILGDVYAMSGLINNSDLQRMFDDYLQAVPESPNTALMNDEERDLVFTYSLPDEVLSTGEIRTVDLESADVMAFKFEYTLEGTADVYVNGHVAASGITLAEEPSEFSVVAHEAASMRNIRITYYGEPYITTGIATITTDLGSGTPRPIHLHDNNSGNTGITTLVINEPVNTIGAWFYANTDGTVIPGVSAAGGVLTGTGMYVNGKPYTAGAVLKDWNFITKTGEVTGQHDLTVPLHSLYLDDQTLNSAQIDDLYETYFGNPIYTATSESIGLVEETAMVISSEWSIVASG